MGYCNNGIMYSPANSACCPSPEIVINESCENLINVPSTAFTIFNVGNAQGAYVSLTYIADNNNTSDVSIIPTVGGAALAAITVSPGTSVTRVYANLNSATIQTVDAGETTDGRLCFKVYNKIFLI